MLFNLHRLTFEMYSFFEGYLLIFLFWVACTHLLLQLVIWDAKIYQWSSIKCDIKWTWLSTFQGKLLLKDVSVDSHDIQSGNVSYKQYCGCCKTQVNSESQFIWSIINWKAWLVFVFWTVSASRTYTKYVVRLCLCNSSNWLWVIANDLRCSVQTITNSRMYPVRPKAFSF